MITERQDVRRSKPFRWSGVPLPIRYALVAGGVSAGYLLIYSAFVVLGVWYPLAILLAQVVAISTAFPLYRAAVFGPGGTVARDFARFMATWSTGAISGFVGTPLLVESGWLHPITAHVLVVVVVAVGSFLGHRLFSFRKTRPTTSPEENES